MVEGGGELVKWIGRSVSGGAEAWASFLSVGCVFGPVERGEVVDLDGIGVDDGEGHAVGGQGEVLTGALDGGTVNLEELPASAGLIDDDGLGADFVGADRLIRDCGRAKYDAAEGEAAAGRSISDGGCDEVAKEALFPHFFATHIEAPKLLPVVAVAAAKGHEFAVADEDRCWCAGGVEGRELVDLAAVGVEVEGPMLMSLIDDGEVARGGGGDVTRSGG